MTKLTAEQVAVNLNLLPQWKYEENKLIKIFKKESFKAAIAFVNNVAELAEEANHHPDILIQFDKVTLSLFTHESHGVTGKDFLLAQKIEML
jgi:4a-hydroxytetrahydrobiopterin dehydratase